MEPVSLEQLGQVVRHEADLVPAIAEELLRFKAHLGFSETLQRELLHAFQRVCKTEHEVRDVGERLMRDSAYCPVPSAVYAAATALRVERVGSERTLETYRDPTKPAKCVICDDTGFVIAVDPEGRDTAVFCTCHPALKEVGTHVAGGN
jgi:hypothetical protein